MSWRNASSRSRRSGCASVSRFTARSSRIRYRADRRQMPGRQIERSAIAMSRSATTSAGRPPPVNSSSNAWKLVMTVRMSVASSTDDAVAQVALGGEAAGDRRLAGPAPVLDRPDRGDGVGIDRAEREQRPGEVGQLRVHRGPRPAARRASPRGHPACGTRGSARRSRPRRGDGGRARRTGRPASRTAGRRVERETPADRGDLVDAERTDRPALEGRARGVEDPPPRGVGAIRRGLAAHIDVCPCRPIVLHRTVCPLIGQSVRRN